MRDRCREDSINNPYYSIPQSQSSAHHHHHHQQSVATSTADVEQLNINTNNNSNNNNSNNNINNNKNNGNNNSLVISPPSSLQIHPSSQTSLASSVSSGSSNQQQQQQQTITPSMLYTVQRVVSTGQLQQLPANYGNNTNASSLTSIIARNETDCGLPINGESFSHFQYSMTTRFAYSKLLTIIIDVIIQNRKNWHKYFGQLAFPRFLFPRPFMIAPHRTSLMRK